jgi:hypothetical protein
VDFSRRAAENQSLFREVNEKIAEFNEAFTAMTPYGDWSCECASTDCIQRIQMTFGEYEQLRATPTHFAVLPDEQHVFPEVERVVERHDRYWVVEKTGIAAKTSVERDPRGRAER